MATGCGVCGEEAEITAGFFPTAWQKQGVIQCSYCSALGNLNASASNKAQFNGAQRDEVTRLTLFLAISLSRNTDGLKRMSLRYHGRKLESSVHVNVCVCERENVHGL